MVGFGAGGQKRILEDIFGAKGDFIKVQGTGPVGRKSCTGVVTGN